MPFAVTIDQDRELVESRWAGVATAELLTAYIDEVWADPAVRCYKEMIDFREITDVQIPSSSIRAFAKYSRLFDNPDTPARSAVVAPQALVFGLSRMFSTIRSLSPGDNREFRVFADIEEARRWLAGPAA